MPAIQGSFLAEQVKTKFRSMNVTLPTIVSTGRPPNLVQFLANRPTGVLAASSSTPAMAASGPKINLGISTGSTSPAPRPTANPWPLPPAFVKAASNDKADVDFQKEISDEINAYIDGICRAIASGLSQWQASATLVDVQINGPIATGGRIVGPPLQPLIQSTGPTGGMVGMGMTYTQKIAAAIATVWQQWQSNVRVPGLPWYPAFAAFPAPVAPPMPNVPTPLGALVNAAQITNGGLFTNEMNRQLGQPGPFSNELFSSIGTALGQALMIWLASTMVTNVMGRGPVPSFAPPYVPVGPVVGGNGTQSPGGLL